MKKSNWMSAKRSLQFLLLIFVIAILSALSSCNKSDPTYYLHIVEGENFQQVQVIDQDSIIYAVIDASIPLNDTNVEYDLRTQFGYSSVYEASVKYWLYKNN